MEDKYQVLLTSDNSGVVCNTTVRDHTTGSSSPNTVCLVGRDYLLSATPERMAGEQVGAVPIVPLHPRACVTVLQFTGDSSHLLSGGADGQVLVWPLVLCVARRSLPGQERGQVGQVQPRYTWTDHALLVTGRVSVGHGPAHHQQLGHDCQGVHHADRADVVLCLLHRPLHFRGDGQHGDHGVCRDQVRTDPLLLPPLPT